MKKKIFIVFVLACVCVGITAYKSQFIASSESNDLMMQNIEALSDPDQSGAKCPNGCKNIGWGVNKILECDCNYDHFSCCESWGC
jgi:hypothetical protein